MDALAAGQFRPGIEACSLHDVAHLKRAFDHPAPFDALAWIEINDDAVGKLDVVDGGVPGVQLDCTDRNQPEEAVEAVDP